MNAARTLMIKPLVRLAILCVANALAVSVAYAQNMVESINATQQGERTVLRIGLKGPVAAAPNSFAVSNPARIAIDLAGTTNAIGRNSVELDQGDVRSASIAQAGDRVRVVLNLKRAVSFTTAVEGNAILVTLEPSASVPQSAAATSPAPARFSEGTSAGHALKDIDFRRGADGTGRVVIDLSDNSTGVDIRQQGQNVVVDFVGTKLPDALRRRLDVADFGTPVQTITTTQNGGNVRMVIEPKGLWEHNAYQSDTQLVVEVKPIKEDPNKLFQGTRGGYRGEKLSFNFQNVETRALLQLIADFTNLNIIASESVTGNITLRLKDVPWDQALDIILQSRGLDMRKNGNVILVAPREELAVKEKLELESKAAIADLEPLRTESFVLNYQKVADVAGIVANSNSRLLSRRGNVVFDVRTNQLFVNDTSSRLEEIRRLIQKIDVAKRQVLIEARIVEADDRFSRNLGAKLGYNDVQSTITRNVTVLDPVTGQTSNLVVPAYGAGNRIGGSAYGTVSGNITGVRDLSSQNGAGTTSGSGGASVVGIGRQTDPGNTNFVDMPAGGINGFNPGQIAFSLFNSKLTRFINLELTALEADGKGKVISSPRVIAADQDKALIEQGTEIPYQQATSSGATSVAFKKANLKLDVSPQITPEGAIILDLDINKDSVGVATSSGLAIDTKHIRTKVLVENGGTVVIGGIYQQTERNQETKVPILGDVPLVGNLFRNQQRQNDRTELLVFITPRIISERSTVR